MKVTRQVLRLWRHDERARLRHPVRSPEVKETLAAIVGLLFVLALIGWGVWYAWFYFTHCAFVPVAEMPGLCLAGSKG